SPGRRRLRPAQRSSGRPRARKPDPAGPRAVRPRIGYGIEWPGAMHEGGATMRAYSNDLRERLVAAVDRGELSLRQIARLFSVSLSCLVRLLQRRWRTGSIQPQPHAGGPTPKLDADALRRLRELVREQPDATLAELHDRLGVPCHLATVARALHRQRITRKKK